MLLEQTVSLADVPRVFLLAFLEISLSADNALVLGVLCHALPHSLRRKALFIGVASAFLFRAGALLVIAFLFKHLWIQLAGAAYLLYLSLRYFLQKRKPAAPQAPHSFWKTVLMIELLDFAFALDSIIAGIAFVEDTLSKLWIVYAGGMIGLIGMRCAADLFSRLIDRFPRLERVAYLMVGWIGLKLALAHSSYSIPSPLFWTFTAFLFLLGFVKLKP